MWRGRVALLALFAVALLVSPAAAGMPTYAGTGDALPGGATVGETLGPELVTQTCAGWGLTTPVGAWSCSGTTITRTSSGSDLAITNAVVVAGKTYEVTWTPAPLPSGTGAFTLSLGGVSAPRRDRAATYTERLKALTTGAITITANSAATNTIPVGVSVREVTSKIIAPSGDAIFAPDNDVILGGRSGSGQAIFSHRFLNDGLEDDDGEAGVVGSEWLRLTNSDGTRSLDFSFYTWGPMISMRGSTLLEFYTQNPTTTLPEPMMTFYYPNAATHSVQVRRPDDSDALILNAPNVADGELTITSQNAGVDLVLDPTKNLIISGSTRVTGNATSVLTGSINATASTAVVGVDTLFTTELQVGDRITVTGETRTVTVITDATHLTVDAAFTDTADDTSPDKLAAEFISRDSAGAVDVIISDRGYVGVNDPAPSNHLTVKTAATGDGIALKNANGYAMAYLKSNAEIGANLELNDGTGNQKVAISSRDTATSYIANNGNFGVGDTSPAYLLTAGSGDMWGVNATGLEINKPQAVTCTAGAGKSALTVTPTSSYIEITNSDADGCDIAMGETGMAAGMVVTLCIVSSAGTTVDFADSGGVSELAGAFAGTVDDCLTLRYGNTTTWREVSRSAN